MSTLDGETDGETDGEMFRNLGFIADVSLVWWVYTVFFLTPLTYYEDRMIYKSRLGF